MSRADQYPWMAEKILSPADARTLAEQLKAEGKRLVTTNGSFDLLHAGHVVLLSEAKQQGDVLFVGVNTDAAIRQYKGPDRPIVPEAERIALLAALACVDFVVSIDATEAGGEIVRMIRPQVHVNGSEYGDPETWAERSVMEEVGARAYVVRRRPGLATTDILQKIRSLS
jgi:D-glycero-beta-D-manno-heptose 1-phosphate adenylyltransferase